MSRIAALAVVLTMVAAPASVAGQDLRAPDQQVANPQPAVTQIDLRSPDAVDGFVAPTAASKPATTNDGGLSWWAFLAIISAAFCACGLLTVMLRRHFQVDGPIRA